MTSDQAVLEVPDGWYFDDYEAGTWLHVVGGRIVEDGVHLMCACADNDANWRGHGLSARYVCSCASKTVSAKGLRWLNS